MVILNITALNILLKKKKNQEPWKCKELPWLFSPMLCFYSSDWCSYRYTPNDRGRQYSRYGTLRCLLKQVKKVKERPSHENFQGNDKIVIKAFNNTKEKFLQFFPLSKPKPPLLGTPVPRWLTCYALSGDNYRQLSPCSSRPSAPSAGSNTFSLWNV